MATGIAPMRPETPLSIVLRRFRKHRAAVVALVVLVGVTLACMVIPLFVSEAESLELAFERKLLSPSAEHPLGTNKLGQDYLVRCLYGGRISLFVGLFATLIAVFIGTVLGALAGVKGGHIDNLTMRLVDLILSLPIFFILLLVASYQRSGTNLTTVVVIIGLTAWTDVCRLVRAEILSLREKEFVEAARALGAPWWRLVLLHLLPNAASPIIVATTLGMARAIIVESALSYLGFGVQPPAASWGWMLKNAQSDMYAYPWLAVFPGVFIFATVLACNFLGDGLRDALDPRIEHRQ